MPMLERIDRTLVTEESYSLFCAVVFAMEQVINRYETLEKELCAHRLNPPYILSLGWDITDWAEKLRKLLGLGRGLRKRDEWFKSIIIELKPLENVRHIIQHFDRSLNNSTFLAEQPMGNLNVWLKRAIGTDGEPVVFSAKRGVRTEYQNLLQTHNRTFVFDSFSMSNTFISKVILEIEDQEVSLNDLTTAIKQAKHGFDSYLYDSFHKKS